jgi:glutamyl-Q tRNA(Asp) synthetase
MEGRLEPPYWRGLVSGPAVTRFAPSPNGHLHLGHAYAAWVAADLAARTGGRFLVRVEDIDLERCRPEYEEAIFEDLEWLGLQWERPVWRQSDHLEDYRRAAERLLAGGLLYPCFCTRGGIQRELAGMTRAPHGPDGPLYPGTCRRLDKEERERRMEAGEAFALRLDAAEALKQAGGILTWSDAALGARQVDAAEFGDVVLARKQGMTSYHLAVVLDDAAQGVTLVTRGEDLAPATGIHRLLQAVLGLPAPAYWHHPLVLDAAGKRLAKRDRSVTLRDLRASGWSRYTFLEWLEKSGLKPARPA